ncbi:hypothetical protein FRACYDRAFT_254282 [Fragilariopsis cylindrus CCMP1102]|uniref:F-box domain-containing protein n=1 Tax=Fragilariopsis cylindrus CCMP1102 TaxID=635003 RepID=A0A1E7EL24_9STRA|nr:hypothetical protein FRACYDRAFT_254282 [Fragilariopsis cylindrus CCMP1102]|eukprot:OEU06584.1 hypothetical protein FRACYDRAFT_254282 [Fragilariopsis cylindrus CCMP1102]
MNSNRKRLSIEDGSIASRTRRQKKSTIASFWNLLLPVPVIIETISWLDQESLMNLCLVSKKLNGIIAGNEPGNENRIIPVFEVIGRTSLETLFENLRGYFKNKKTKNKLIIAEDIQMNGITSLDFSTSFSPGTINSLTSALFIMLPNLRQVDMSNTNISATGILSDLSRYCPSLEKLTMHNSTGFYISAYDMIFSKKLKEIYIDNSYFHGDNQDSDLNDHQDTFMFHYCCDALERVSIRNMRFMSYLGFDDEQQFAFSQNVSIKFIRNAPQTLRWFRSDLTQENMEMLRMERPGIELLN